MSKQAKNNKNSSSSEEESSNNSNSSGSEASSSGSESQSGSNSNSKNSEPTLKKPGFVTVKIDQQKANRKSKSNLIEEKPKKKTENKGFKSNELNISNLKSVKTLNSDDQLSQKIKNLLNSNSESKDSTRIENGTIKKVSEDRKIALPRNFNPIKNSDDEDDDHMFSEFSAQKIKQLEVKLSVKTKENQGNLDKIQELTEEINEVLNL